MRWLRTYARPRDPASPAPAVCAAAARVAWCVCHASHIRRSTCLKWNTWRKSSWYLVMARLDNTKETGHGAL